MTAILCHLRIAARRPAAATKSIRALGQFCFALILSGSLLSGQRVITTIAGADAIFPRNSRAAPEAPLAAPAGMAADNRGNLFVALPGFDVVVRLSREGTVTVAAGNGLRGLSGDGDLAVNASLSSPTAVAVDANGSLYISDNGNTRIRRVSPDGIITTFAGGSVLRVITDGSPAVPNRIEDPHGLAFDSAGNLFVASRSRNVVYRITPGGIITRVAGLESPGDAVGTLATETQLYQPTGLAFDASGNLYICEAMRISRVSPLGRFRTMAGFANLATGFSGDGGAAVDAQLDHPAAVAVDSQGIVYIADTENHRIRRVSVDGKVSTIAGTGPAGTAGGGFSGDGGTATQALLSRPGSVLLDLDGNLLIADSGNNRLRQLSPRMIIQSIAGSGLMVEATDGIPATSFPLGRSLAVAADIDGNVLVSDFNQNYVWRIAGDGTIHTVAGTGRRGYSGDGGPAVSAALDQPGRLAVDRSRNLYIVDGSGNRIRRVSADGVITTVARGSGISSLTVDLSGNLYFADGFGVIQQVSAIDGVTRRYAGGGGTLARANLPPISATDVYFGGRLSLAGDNTGNLYVASELDVVFRISPDRLLTAVAGTSPQVAGSVPCVSGEGVSAVRACLNRPSDVTVDNGGNLYIIESGAIRQVTPGGLIYRIAGGPFPSPGKPDPGDGSAALDAFLSFDSNTRITIAADGDGNLYFPTTDQRFFFPSNVSLAGSLSGRVRKILASPLRLSVRPGTLSFHVRSRGPVSATQSLIVAADVAGVPFQVLPPDAGSIGINTPGGFDAPGPVDVNLAKRTPRIVELTVDPSQLSPGQYDTFLRIRSPLTTPGEFAVKISVSVAGELSPLLDVDQRSLSFTFPRGAARRSRSLQVSNKGGGTLTFSASVTAPWLDITPAAGSCTPDHPVTLTVSADPARLEAGTYTGTIVITATDGQKAVVNVVLTRSESEQAILLSQSGISFLAVEGGGVVPPQEFGILNLGTAATSWQVSTPPLSGVTSWLHTDVTSGTTTPEEAVPLVQAMVNTSALRAGAYYGLVQVDAPAAVNSPQVLTALLQVLPREQHPPSIVQPAELLFVAPELPNSGQPGSREIRIYNLTASPITYRSSVQYTFVQDGVDLNPLTDGYPGMDYTPREGITCLRNQGTSFCSRSCPDILWNPEYRNSQSLILGWYARASPVLSY